MHYVEMGFFKTSNLRINCFLLFSVVAFECRGLEANRNLPVLSFEELETARDNPGNSTINSKIDRLFRSSQIVNTNSHGPKKKSRPEIGEYLSVVTWNIEKSLEIEDVLNALKSKEDFLKLVSESLKNNPKK